jgi:hypothetical protein
MQTLVQDIAQECGLGEDKVRGALGVLMGYLLDAIKKPTERRVQQAHPELCRLAKAYRKKPGGGGFFGALLGSKADLLALPGKLSRMGVGRGALKKLVPMTLDWLRENTSEELWAQVKSELPSSLG